MIFYFLVPAVAGLVLGAFALRSLARFLSGRDPYALAVAIVAGSLAGAILWMFVRGFAPRSSIIEQIRTSANTAGLVSQIQRGDAWRSHWA